MAWLMRAVRSFHRIISSLLHNIYCIYQYQSSHYRVAIISYYYYYIRHTWMQLYPLRLIAVKRSQTRIILRLVSIVSIVLNHVNHALALDRRVHRSSTMQYITDLSSLAWQFHTLSSCHHHPRPDRVVSYGSHANTLSYTRSHGGCSFLNILSHWQKSASTCPSA